MRSTILWNDIIFFETLTYETKIPPPCMPFMPFALGGSRLCRTRSRHARRAARCMALAVLLGNLGGSVGFSGVGDAIKLDKSGGKRTEMGAQKGMRWATHDFAPGFSFLFPKEKVSFGTA